MLLDEESIGARERYKKKRKKTGCWAVAQNEGDCES